MMIVHKDKMSALSSRERAQRLYEKNIELENKRRKAAQARVPSDPNAWQQIRENYEVIILEDHAFSEQHNIEYALWQLHYRRIEELRAHYSAAHSSKGSNATQGVKGPPRPDRTTKIRLQFKTFLSEASGFYHDLIVKIRANYGLSLDYFSDDSENRNAMEKDGNKSIDMKKGLISCHQCLIYLGDLARYKGLYGDGDSKTREYATASSYYLQAASLWPSSGNPHHQLAILSSYASDELMTVYRYFRSLAVESPFSTARDNLIVAFEKNRQSYSQLPVDVKGSGVKESTVRFAGRGRGKEAKLLPKDANMEVKQVAASSIPDTYKSFCIRFVRLNGILFTRTSLETFAEVSTSVSNAFCELLSSGPEEELNFGADTVENGLVLVRLVAILIFTVHNVHKESEGQTYAEIVQRAVLLQNAYSAVFEVLGHILERCVQLRDPSSSYLLPGILVFVEWLACYPDIAAGKDMEEKQATVRSKFWHHCISFWNKLLSDGPMSFDGDGDETCFYNMSRYEEGETENRLALREDFELRGFLPLIPAQIILDFSRKHSFGSDGSKERRARVKRILAAGKALANMVRVDKETVHFDSKLKKFVIGVETQVSDDFVVGPYSGQLNAQDVMQESQAEKILNTGIVQPLKSLYAEVDDDDEVIVFKPVASEKRTEVPGPELLYNEGLGHGQSMPTGNLPSHAASSSAPLDNLRQWSAFDGTQQAVVSSGNAVPHQHLQPIQPQGSPWSVEEEVSLANSLRGLRFVENGHVMKHGMQENVGIPHQSVIAAPVQQSINLSANGSFYSQTNAMESLTPSKVEGSASFAVNNGSLGFTSSSPFQGGLRKNPVSRPIRHIGPPPGFSPVPPRQVYEPVNGSELTVDDYSWLDGYQLPPSGQGQGLNSSINYSSQGNLHYGSNSSGVISKVSFPFPGKQIPPVPFQVEKQKVWQDHQPFENLKSHHEQMLQQHQQLMNGNQQLVNGSQQLMNGNQFAQLPEQYQGQPKWTGRYIV